MSNSPDNARKIEVLNRAPFLRTYLDTNSRRLAPTLWQNQLTTNGEAVRDRMNDKLGNSWETLTVIPQLITGEDLRVFHPGLSMNLRFALVKSNIMFGFEAGNGQDAHLFLPEVVKAMADDQSLNPLTLLIESQRIAVVDYTNALLRVGGYLAESPAELLLPKNDTPDFLNKFIDGLDLRGL